ncbi:MAG: DUF3108 domain-containing protein [Gemmatimonadaceae bacterium]
MFATLSVRAPSAVRRPAFFRSSKSAVVLICAVSLAGAQEAERPSASVTMPFRAGEKFTYDASFGIIRVGSGTIELSGFDTVRSRLAWRATMTVSGGLPLYRVRDSTVSWFDVRSLSSLRYVQHLREGSYRADRDYEIYPERSTFSKNGKPESPSVAEPLDETSFLFFLRIIPLELGKSYVFSRYFQPEGNPVVINVLRRERIKVPAGTFNTIVVQPQIAAPGLFSKKEHAEVWITDDSARMVVQIKSHVTFGSLRLALRRYEPGIGGGASRTGH